MRRLLIAAWLLAVTGAASARAQEPADLLLHDGKVFAADELLSTYSAVAVRDGRISRAAHERGWQLGFHTIGDAAIAMTVDVWARLLEASPRADHRHFLTATGRPIVAGGSRPRRTR